MGLLFPNSSPRQVRDSELTAGKGTGDPVFRLPASKEPGWRCRDSDWLKLMVAPWAKISLVLQMRNPGSESLFELPQMQSPSQVMGTEVYLEGDPRKPKRGTAASERAESM